MRVTTVAALVASLVTVVPALAHPLRVPNGPIGGGIDIQYIGNAKSDQPTTVPQQAREDLIYTHEERSPPKALPHPHKFPFPTLIRDLGATMALASGTPDSNADENVPPAVQQNVARGSPFLEKFKDIDVSRMRLAAGRN